MGQLMWREFYYVAAAAEPNFDKMVGNKICRQIPWHFDDQLISAWYVVFVFFALCVTLSVFNTFIQMLKTNIPKKLFLTGHMGEPDIRLLMQLCVN